MKSKILVINDDPDALELISFVLDQSGYEVLTADGGKSGLETAVQTVPDLIISDVRMPDLDGFEVCKLLREDPRLKTTPVILVTAASKDTGSAVKGLKAGADDYLEAPLDPTRLAAKVARMLEREQLEIERKKSAASLLESREMLRLAMSGSRMGAWSRDLVRDEVEWSEELEAIFGFPAGAFAKSLDAYYERVYPDDRMRVRQAALTAVDERRDYTVEFRFYHSDGSLRWMEGRGKAVYDADGTPTKIYGIGIDITDRKQSEADLRQSQNHLALAQQIGKMGSFEWDFKAGKFIVSKELDVLYGVNTGNLQGGFSAWLNFVHPDDREAVEQEMEDVLLSGNLLNEYRIITPAGETRWISAIAKVFYDSEGKPERIVGVNKNITERKQTELRLLESEKRFRAIFDNAAIGIGLVDLEGQIFLSNHALQQMLGYTEKELQSMSYTELTHREDIEKDLILVEELFKGRTNYYQIEKRYTKKNGDVIWGHLTASAVSNAGGETLFAIGMIEDVTVRKQLESQLRQAQKLESVGRLAGGIAHDFNNMLTAINGYSDLTLRKLEPENSLRGNIEEIKKAGERSAQLTHQLLAFSRQQILQPKVLDLNETIHDTSKMLQRLIGEDIELQLVLNPKIRQIYADPGQLTQVIMNLIVNARDAMPDGGKIVVQTDDIYLDEEFVKGHYPMEIGNYVMLSVSDNGTGMDEKTQRQIFEPFFTTKAQGEGTGLGLSTVYGIVKQSGGYIWVESELKRGTTLLIYFPSVIEETKPEETMGADYIFQSGSEAILIVEDEPMVRSLTRQILEECGYQVLEAGSGHEALKICEQSNCRIDLLMTDVVMPGMSGRELAEKLMILLPHIKVLFTSGYTTDAVIKHGISEAKQNFIQKPFTFEILSKKVRNIIDNVDL
jgi:PAS domain S-box-containing protein